MADCYEFRRSGRRPLTIASLGTANTCFGLVAVSGGSSTVWNIWFAVVALLAWHVLANPVAGLRLTAQSLTCYRELRQHCVPLSDIRRVEINDSHRLTVRLILHNGRVLALPRAGLPPLATLTRQLAAHGLDLRPASGSAVPNSAEPRKPRPALHARPRPAS